MRRWRSATSAVDRDGGDGAGSMGGRGRDGRRRGLFDSPCWMMNRHRQPTTIAGGSGPGDQVWEPVAVSAALVSDRDCPPGRVERELADG
jgi:hypothetical protein